MATAVATPTVTQTWFDGKMFHAIGTIAVDANPDTYATGGLVLDFAQDLIKAQRVPQFVDIKGQAGYQYTYINGTDVTDGLLMIRAQTNGAAEDDPLGELTNGAAIPAACSGDTIKFHAMWLGQN